ncbi:MAG: hypothetical protein F4X40_08550 [Chloroflexi bacterium]|nr:hypothetical protein [Chloroflexota bacterium]
MSLTWTNIRLAGQAIVTVGCVLSSVRAIVGAVNELRQDFHSPQRRSDADSAPATKQLGPKVRTGPRAGQVRARNLNGQWRRKRRDAGIARGPYRRTRSAV